MAVPQNTVTEHNVIGTREDLQDIVYDISPTETPFINGIARLSAEQVYHEWQIDELDQAGSNAHIEGDDATADAFSPTDRIGNYCQISRKTVSVSRTSQKSNQAGRNNELSYQMIKRGEELKRDMEYALVRNQASSAGGDATARTLAGAESWLATNTVGGTGYADGGFSSGIVAAPTDGTQAAFTKANLDTVMQSIWTQGGNPTIIMTGPYNRTVFSGFDGVSTLETTAGPDKQVTLIGVIDIYRSNFGTIEIVPNRFMRERTALVLDLDYWATAYLDPIQMEDLAKTGDSDKKMMVVEYTLVCKNEKASGKLADLTTS